MGQILAPFSCPEVSLSDGECGNSGDSYTLLHTFRISRRDQPDSKSGGSNPVGVRVPPSAQAKWDEKPVPTERSERREVPPSAPARFPTRKRPVKGVFHCWIKSSPYPKQSQTTPNNCTICRIRSDVIQFR